MVDFTMSSDTSADPTPKQICKADTTALDEAIDAVLGLGLRYKAWPEALSKQGQAWYPALKKVIIKKEYELFREEIQRLRLEDKVTHPSRVQSNSLNSILKRLKGKPWVDGLPGEREQRLLNRTLISKDAK